jgi:transposase
MTVFCGIDWSERHHDVALVDQDGTLIVKRRIGESVEDFAGLLTLLAEAGDSAEEPIPVAIETSRGLLVAALRATGRPIYAINPMAVARYRERHCVSRKKSDHADAMTLANILRTDAHAHRRLPADSELAQSDYRPGSRRSGRHLATHQGYPGTAGPAARVLTPASWPPSLTAASPT